MAKEQTPPAEIANGADNAAGKAPSKPAVINLDTPKIKEAIAQGKVLIKDGKSKADAARAMFALIHDEQKEAIVAAFVEGATLTEKGALTYWYNCKRRANRAA